jgi:hypothetical protein
MLFSQFVVITECWLDSITAIVPTEAIIIRADEPAVEPAQELMFLVGTTCSHLESCKVKY